MFEKAMQAVNPAVSLFYWDYTIETETHMKIGDSPMFTPDTFGTLNFPADNYWGWTYSNDSMMVLTQSLTHAYSLRMLQFQMEDGNRLQRI